MKVDGSGQRWSGYVGRVSLTTRMQDGWDVVRNSFFLLLRLCVEYQYKNQTGYVEDVYNYSQLNNRWKVFIFQ